MFQLETTIDRKATKKRNTDQTKKATNTQKKQIKNDREKTGPVENEKDTMSYDGDSEIKDDCKKKRKKSKPHDIVKKHTSSSGYGTDKPKKLKSWVNA